MRQIINISLPPHLANLVETEVKTGKFASKSEFFRHLIRLWSDQQLLKQLKASEKEIRSGKGFVLHSLKDLR